MNIFDGHPCAVSVEPGEKNKHDERDAHTGLRGLVLPAEIGTGTSGCDSNLED